MMNSTSNEFQLVPLGDQAALAYLADEAAALRFAAAMRKANAPWVIDVVQAYQSVAVFFDADRVSFAQAADRMRGHAAADPEPGVPTTGRLHRVPCCYGWQLDMSRVAEATGLTAEEIVQLHAGTEYTVYAIGFCPGFPYLGYLPQALSGVPRLASPRVRVEAGSVGMTGRQTGIYTEVRPGGWNIIGRTPLELVNVRDGYFPLRGGDRVRFEPIAEEDFRRLQGKRL